jgi:hypothetical protein
MGRSLLSVKLALAFGVCVAVVVLVAERVMASPVERAPAAAEQPVQVPMEAAVEQKTGAEVCLWRGCPITLPHRYLRTTADAPRRGDRRTQAS